MTAAAAAAVHAHVVDVGVVVDAVDVVDVVAVDIDRPQKQTSFWEKIFFGKKICDEEKFENFF